MLIHVLVLFYCATYFSENVQTFLSEIVLLIIIYFMVGYVKLYLQESCNSLKINLIGICIGGLCPLLLVIITNQLGLELETLSDKLRYWGDLNSPFFLLFAISGLNIARKLSVHSRLINNISILSMLTYIIHENYLFGTYVRSRIWTFLYYTLGYEHIIILDLLYALCLFILSLIMAKLYVCFLQKTVYRVGNRIYYFIENRQQNML